MRPQLAAAVLTALAFESGCATSSGGSPPSEREAAAQNAIAYRFAYCASWAARAMQMVTRPEAKAGVGRLHTQFLWGVAVFVPEDQLAEPNRIMAETAYSSWEQKTPVDELSQRLTALGSSCSDQLEQHRTRLEAATPTASAAARLRPEEGKTNPLQVLAARGRPMREDYNPDGRFSWVYETATGFDAFLFDGKPGFRLVRVRSFCDKLKGPCAGASGATSPQARTP